MFFHFNLNKFVDVIYFYTEMDMSISVTLNLLVL
jgi:hypothetical protein